MTEAEQESHPTKTDSGDESEDESEVLEESPCGRWQKRREEVCNRENIELVRTSVSQSYSIKAFSVRDCNMSDIL